MFNANNYVSTALEHTVYTNVIKDTFVAFATNDTPTICVLIAYLTTLNCICCYTGLNFLRGLKLADPVTQKVSFEISLMIGADFRWDIVEDEISRGNGPTAVKSKLGY